MYITLYITYINIYNFEQNDAATETDPTSLEKVQLILRINIEPRVEDIIKIIKI